MTPTLSRLYFSSIKSYMHLNNRPKTAFPGTTTGGKYRIFKYAYFIISCNNEHNLIYNIKLLWLLPNYFMLIQIMLQ